MKLRRTMGLDRPRGEWAKARPRRALSPQDPISRAQRIDAQIMDLMTRTALAFAPRNIFDFTGWMPRPGWLRRARAGR